jgi:predicted GH43/DUF377 family glycosyl hydrolase
MRSNPALIVAISFLIITLALLPNAFAATQEWVKYAGNPVLLPTAGSWDGDYVTTPRVLYDNTTYRMWYMGGLSGVNRIGYATSSDGINWVKHGIVLGPGLPGDWDSSSIALGSVLWNGTTYLMWYTGTNGTVYPGGAIGLAFSTDGLNWVRYSRNPILIPSELGNDQKYIAAPYVIRLKLTYNMWYTGKSAATPNTNRILYATSFDGIHWSKWPSPVLSPSQDPTAWDSNGVYAPSVIWNGQIFGIWYSGLNQTGLVPRVGYAVSLDGGSWTRSANNPVLEPGPVGTWDSAGVEQPSVIQVGKNFMLFYDGYSKFQGQRIGLALSPQGFALPEFPAPGLEILIGLIACSIVYVSRGRRQRTKQDPAIQSHFSLRKTSEQSLLVNSGFIT